VINYGTLFRNKEKDAAARRCEMDKPAKTGSAVQSVDRALMILELLQENGGGLGITELANRMDLAKSTVHRLLTSLKNKGYVRQDTLTEKYQLGLKLIELGSAVTQSLEIRKTAAPIMNKLVEETGETAHLVVLEDGEVVYIEKIESPCTIRMYSLIGKRAPVHCTAVGKALIAHLPEEQVHEIIQRKGLKRFTENTIVSREVLMAQLRQIRANGYSRDDEEHEAGIQCIAAPVFDHSGKAAAAVSISGPKMRMTEEKIASCIDNVMSCAREISKRLGCRA
jgi:DNA-binding IclR family transcriptional regulator